MERELEIIARRSCVAFDCCIINNQKLREIVIPLLRRNISNQKFAISNLSNLSLILSMINLTIISITRVDSFAKKYFYYPLQVFDQVCKFLKHVNNFKLFKDGVNGRICLID